MLNEMGPGWRDLVGKSRNAVRLRRALASPEVASIQLRNEHGLTQRAPGVDGFCVLGITDQEPITSVCGLDARGTVLPGRELLL